MAVRSGLRVLSLCSGYGGLDLGVWLGTGGQARAVCHVEREAFAASILAAQMEAGNLASAPIWSDLLTFDARRWRGAVDLVTAGIPCQPFSLAGKQKGRDDARWLGPAMLRIVRESGARALFLEEVPAFATAGLPEVVQALEAWGWRWEAIRVAAEDCGAPHRRVRLFVLAVAFPHRQRLDRERSGGLLDGQREAPRHDADGCSGEAVADPDSPRPQGRQRDQGDPDQERSGVAGRAGSHVGHAEGGQRDGQRLAPEQPQRTDRGPGGRAGLPYWPPGRDPAAWEGIPTILLPAEPVLRGVADGAPAQLDQPEFPAWPHRVRAVGNGVVPIAAAVAWRVLLNKLTGGSR